VAHYGSKAYLDKSSAVAEMGDGSHNTHGPKRGGCYARFAGGAGSPSNTKWPRVEVYFRTKWRPHPSSRLATIHMNRKLGVVPLLGGECDPI